MKPKEIKIFKEYLKEIDCDIEFDKENEDKLVGYAERFGGEIIFMYKNVNTFFLDKTEETISEIELINPSARKADGFEDTIIGYIFIDGKAYILHDRDRMIDQMINEYEEDPSFEEEDGYDYYTMAMENYQYNIIGAYVDGVPAFAITNGW